MLHLGLCCMFHKEPIKFRTYTKKKLESLDHNEAADKMMEVCLHNINTLKKAIDYCKANKITSYRIGSDIIPHWEYINERCLLTSKDMEYFKNKLQSIDSTGVTLSMHPGQHVNMGSPTPDVVERSITDLRYHKMFADCLGFKEINIHLGGAYGDPEAAKKRFIENVRTQIPEIIPYLTIENDELCYNVLDCFEVCSELGCRLTYDLHHQRCNAIDNPIEYTEQQLFAMARQTWIRADFDYMRMHISTAKNGYTTPSKSRPHSDMIDSADIPGWLTKEAESFPIHIDVEAKHKETAVFTLREQLNKRG